MNKYFKTGMIALLSLCLWACQGCKNDLPGYQQGTVPIGFAPNVEAPTRGEDLTSVNLPSFGVFAYFTQGGEFDESTSTPNYLYNEKVYKTGGTGDWTYDNTRYWPANGTDKLSFFAYAPHGAEGLTSPATSAKGYPVLTYTVPSTEAAQSDLLVAAPLMNRSYTAPTPPATASLNFTMKHALTKVTFKVKNAAETVLSVSGFSLKAMSSAQLTYNSTAFAWTKFNTATTSCAGTVSADAPISVPIPTTDETTGIATFYALPDKTGATFSITWTADGVTKTLTDQALPDTYAWDMGTAVTYIVTIKPNNITEVIAVGGTWSDGGSQAITSKHLVLGPDDLKPGDFYYSDNTTSDGGYREYSDGTYIQEDGFVPVLNNPDTGAARTVIGIVFSIDLNRMGTAAKEALAAKGVTTPHGLVMALTHTTTCPWGDAAVDENSGGTAGEPFVFNRTTVMQTYQNVDGYAETKWIIDNHADALQTTYTAFYHTNRYGTAADASSSKYQAPQQSTGWFIPSTGHWWDILSNLGKLDLSPYRTNDTASDPLPNFSGSSPGGEDIVNSVINHINFYLNKIEGASSIEESHAGRYWTSSESGAGEAYTCFLILNPGISLGLFHIFTKDDPYNNYYVRPVLAF